MHFTEQKEPETFWNEKMGYGQIAQSRYLMGSLAWHSIQDLVACSSMQVETNICPSMHLCILLSLHVSHLSFNVFVIKTFHYIPIEIRSREALNYWNSQVSWNLLFAIQLSFPSESFTSINFRKLNTSTSIKAYVTKPRTQRIFYLEGVRNH